MLVSAAALGGTPLGAGTASAACGSEYAIFWKGQSSAYGTREEIGITNRTADPDCSVFTELVYGSTAYVALGSIWGNWVEVGWEARYAEGTEFITFFNEGAINNTIRWNHRGVNLPCTNDGSFQRYQVNNVTGTFDWDAWVDCQDGQGFRRIGTMANTGYEKGLAVGETWRFGDQTTMGDVHRNMFRRDGGGNWVAWTGVACYFDQTPGWHGTAVSTTRYDTVVGYTNCNNT
jgi:hypothetical protein